MTSTAAVVIRAHQLLVHSIIAAMKILLGYFVPGPRFIEEPGTKA